MGSFWNTVEAGKSVRPILCRECPIQTIGEDRGKDQMVAELVKCFIDDVDAAVGGNRTGDSENKLTQSDTCKQESTPVVWRWRAHVKKG